MSTAAGRDRWGDALALASFVALGLPDGMIGTAWTAMHVSFRVPVGDLGLVQLTSTAGAAALSTVLGRVMRRTGVPPLIVLAALLGGGGALGYALSPSLAVLLPMALLPGASAGLIDGSLNTVVAVQGRPRLLNLLHGFYGIGTALGPLVVTVAIVTGSWRPAYVVLLAVDVLVGAAWLTRLRRPSSGATGGAPAAPAPAETHPADTWRRRRVAGIVVLGMAVFFVYTGLEVTAGQWEASFARTTLGLSAAAAGLATFGYWAALTAARIGLALRRRPVPPPLVVRTGVAGAALAVAAVWWRPAPAVAVVGFVVLGASLAGIFPSLVALTPVRLGTERAGHVIPWQVGAAVIGGPAVSALTGLIVDRSSLAALGPVLAGATLVLALLCALNARTYTPSERGAPGEGLEPPT